MAFKLLLYADGSVPEAEDAMRDWPAQLRAEVPEAELHLAASEREAEPAIAEVEAAFGQLPPGLFAKAKRLKWLASPRAGPEPSFYHRALVESQVVVTNVRGIYNDHISAHIMAFLLGFARGLPVYRDRQRERLWRKGAPTVYLPEATVLLVGVGGIGGETARRCREFGMTVLGVDPRAEAMPDGIGRMHRPAELDRLLPRADFVVLTVPETPATQRFFDRSKLGLMKRTAYLINIGRGATVVLDDLNRALREGVIAGAALDVFETEPLPAEHPLWEAPGMVMTPHVAADGPHLGRRRYLVFRDNCRRFAAGQPLRNVVDKANWF
jgi:phosphoglycerate dehydrogenase-like enzyme